MGWVIFDKAWASRRPKYAGDDPKTLEMRFKILRAIADDEEGGLLCIFVANIEQAACYFDLPITVVMR